MTDHRTTLRIDDDLYERVDAFAEREGRSHANAVRVLLRRALTAEDARNGEVPSGVTGFVLGHETRDGSVGRVVQSPEPPDRSDAA